MLNEGRSAVTILAFPGVRRRHHNIWAATKSTAAAAVGIISAMAENERPESLAPMDFSTFVLSLGSSAMVNLGKVQPPEGMASAVDLAAAKQIIDILGILEEKTKGNLTDSEAKLLGSLLYDLRVQYVDAEHDR